MTQFVTRTWQQGALTAEAWLNTVLVNVRPSLPLISTIGEQKTWKKMFLLFADESARKWIITVTGTSTTTVDNRCSTTLHKVIKPWIIFSVFTSWRPTQLCSVKSLFQQHATVPHAKAEHIPLTLILRTRQKWASDRFFLCVPFQ